MNNEFNILIVEDDNAAGKVIALQLKEQEYHTYHFERAEKALLFFQQNPFDLALWDYKLPGMSGEELYIKIKEINPMIPVIFMTVLQSLHNAVRLRKWMLLLTSQNRCAWKNCSIT